MEISPQEKEIIEGLLAEPSETSEHGENSSESNESIKEQQEQAEEFPWFKCTFTPDGVEVEAEQWERINARALERAIRAVRKHRNLQRKLIRRQTRLKEGING